MKLDTEQSNSSAASESGAAHLKEEDRRDSADKHVTFSMKPGKTEKFRPG